MLNNLKIFLVKILFYVIGYCPLPVLHGLGFVLGCLLSLLPIRFTYYIRRNIELCFPKWSKAKRLGLYFKACREICKSMIELPVFFVRPQQHITRLIRNPDAIQPLKEAQQQQKGFIVLGLHLGGYYAKNAYLSEYFPGAVNLFKAQKGAVGQVLLQWTQRFQGRLATTTRKGVLTLLRALRSGSMAGIICDHNVLDNGNAWVPFFGYKVPTTSLPVKLAQKSTAPAFMVAMERLSWARGYRFHVWPMPAEFTSADLEQGASSMNQMLEHVIRQFPSQYEWHYRRFWDTLDGESPRYKTQVKQ